MLNTIILAIIGIFGTIYFMRTINGIDNDNFHFTDLLVTVLCFSIIIQARFCSIDYSGSMNRAKLNGYEDGFNAAIESAELIEVNDNNYFIRFGSFSTEIHEYTFND